MNKTMETKRYYNEKENKWYTSGRGITHRIDENRIFSGVPSEEQLKEWGYTEFVPPVTEESDELDIAQ